MEAIQVFWQNWYGFVAEINNFHGVAYQRHLPFSNAILSCRSISPIMWRMR